MGMTKSTETKVFFSDPFISDFEFKSVSSLFNSRWRDVVPVQVESSLTVDESHFYVIECKKRPAPDSQEIWDLWNQSFLQILSRNSSLLNKGLVSFSDLKTITDEVPKCYSVWSKLQRFESELLEDEAQIDDKVSIKSFLCMLRFLPVLEARQKDLSFYLNEKTKSFGFVLTKSARSKQRLDLRFRENGEILFSFIDGIEGFSRISGTSYLTDYLSNSSKIRKIINLFDY